LGGFGVTNDVDGVAFSFKVEAQPISEVLLVFNN
jgi:hypothetical protein